jgi:hypothetical protein
LWKQLTPATPLVIFAIWLLSYALLSICRKPDPLFFEKTFQQDFSKQRAILDKDREEYRAQEFRPSYTDMLTVQQCVETHSEMKAQVERLCLDKQHMHKSFHD